VITVVGEALIDLVGADDGVYRALPGGAPANVAVGLARLGSPVTLLTRLGVDAFGARLRAHLEGNGVSARDVVEVAAPTTLAVATLDADGRATYDFYVEGTTSFGWRADELPAALAPDVDALICGSLALAVAPGAAAVEALVQRERARGAVTIVLDPNVRPALAAGAAAERERVERQARHAQVVKTSDEDVRFLYGDKAIEDVAARWLGLGVSVVVVTLGRAGAYARTRSREVRVAPRLQVDVVDTVGAGDAFCAGLVDALRTRGLLGADPVRLADPPLEDLLTTATLVATLTCQRAGADPPTADEVAAAIRLV
jgi:fructokinase